MNRSFERVDFIEKTLKALVPRVDATFNLAQLARTLIKAKVRLRYIKEDLKAKKFVKNPTLKYTWFVKNHDLHRKDLKKKPFIEALRVLDTAGFVVLNEKDEVVEIGPLADITRDLLSTAPIVAEATELEDNDLLLYTIIAYNRKLLSNDGIAITSPRLAKLSAVTASTAKAYLERLVREGLLNLVKGERKNVYKASPKLKKIYKDAFAQIKTRQEAEIGVVKEHDAEAENFQSETAASDVVAEPIATILAVTPEAPRLDPVEKQEPLMPFYKAIEDQEAAKKNYKVLLEKFKSEIGFSGIKSEVSDKIDILLALRAGMAISQPEQIKCRIQLSMHMRKVGTQEAEAIRNALTMEMPEPEREPLQDTEELKAS